MSRSTSPRMMLMLAAGLLLASCVVILGMKWWHLHVAIDTVHRHGGIVWGPGGLRRTVWRPRLPFVDPVRDVSFSNPEFNDEDLDEVVTALERLGEVRRLSLNGTQVTNRGVEHLLRLPLLETLFLGNTQIDDGAVDAIVQLQQMRILDLSRTRITDSGARRLGGLRHLQELSLDGSEVGDAGISGLSGCRELTTLSVSNTNVSDEGLNRLAERLPSLAVSDD